MSSLPSPGARWKYLSLAVALTAGLSALLVFFNHRYLFNTVIDETGDPALNSLAVLRAARFHEIYGAYSRWDLHHPGPALFYWFAWMEELLYRSWHAVPTPYNAQVLASMILSSSLLAGAICVAARWVRSVFFLPLTLLLAILHYTAVGPDFCMMSTWPPYTMPMIFLALLLASASVGAGQGDDLPLLVLAGGFAVHSNLAQPLFVVPLALAGYLGLTVSCWRAARETRASAAVASNARTGSESGQAPATAAISALPWRQFPRAHAFAALVLAAFLLPLGADLCKGSESNLVLMFRHLPRDPTKHHAWLACFYYFLRFGGYRPSLPGAEYNFAGHASGAEIFRFCAEHAKTTALWLSALFSPLLAWGLPRWWRRAADAAGAADTPAFPAQPEAATAAAVRRQRWHFLGWLFACWLLSIGLTLYWAHLLEIEMSYYQIWFSYSIWFVLAMIGAASVSDILETCAARTGRRSRWLAAVGLLSAGGMAATICTHPAKFHVTDYTDRADVAQAEVIKAALAEQAAGTRTKIISYPEVAWGAAGGLAVLLERQGYDARVAPEYLVKFGPDHAPPDLLEGLSWTNGVPNFDIWRIVPAAQDPAAAASRPLVDGNALVLSYPELDPNPGAEITFSGPRPNYETFAPFGWTKGMQNLPFIWSEGALGLLCFHPKPIPAGTSVELVFDGFPLLAKGVRDVQRVDLALNDYHLGTWQLDRPVLNPLPRLLIAAAVWNQSPVAVLTLRFRDKISPLELHQNDDPRQFALGTRKITFQTVKVQIIPSL